MNNITDTFSEKNNIKEEENMTGNNLDDVKNNINMEENMTENNLDYLVLEKAFNDYINNGYVPVRSRGHNPKYNPKGDYKKAKTPIDKGFTSKSFTPKSVKELIEWVKQGGWIGWLLPDGVVAIDVENNDAIQQIFNLIKRMNIEDKVGIHKTKNGYHFIFKKGTFGIKADSQAFIKLGINVTFRIGGKNYLILAPTEDREWQNYVKVNDLTDIPEELTPLNKSNVDDLLTAVTLQIKYYRSKKKLNGYDDIDMAFMGYLAVDLGLDYDSIETIFKVIFEADFDDNRTKTVYDSAINKTNIKKTGSLIDKLKNEKLDYLVDLINLLEKEISSDSRILATDENVIEEFKKNYKIVLTNSNEYYIVYNDGKNMIPLYNNSKRYTHPFESMIKDDFIYKFYEMSANGTKDYKFTSFWHLLNNKILHQDEMLEIIDVELSNLSVIKDNKLILNSDIAKGVIITKDNFNLCYDNSIKAEKSSYIEDEMRKLFPEVHLLITAQIISSIINETGNKKHLLLLTGSAEIGKSTTAEFISRIITDSYKTITVVELHKMWSRFFATRCPVLDNVDEKKNLTSKLASDLSQLLTTNEFTANERYSVDGRCFISHVYPIITSIHDDLLSIDSALKSREITCKLVYNEYAKYNIDRIIEDEDFLMTAKSHFYKLVEEYLEVKDSIKLSKEAPRSRNFFKVLFWLDEDYTEKIIDDMNQSKEYLSIVEEFITMIRSNTSLQNTFKKASEWSAEYIDYLEKECGGEFVDDVNNKYINTYIKTTLVGGKLAEFLMEERRTKRGKEYMFKTPTNSQFSDFSSN